MFVSSGGRKGKEEDSGLGRAMVKWIASLETRPMDRRMWFLLVVVPISSYVVASAIPEWMSS